MSKSDAYWSTEFNDGIVTGRILFKKGECGHCKKPARLLFIQEISLPNGIAASEKFIYFEEKDEDGSIGEIPAVGITCGCYAKGARQIAYVLARRKAKGKA